MEGGRREDGGRDGGEDGGSDGVGVRWEVEGGQREDGGEDGGSDGVGVRWEVEGRTEGGQEVTSTNTSVRQSSLFIYIDYVYSHSLIPINLELL